MTTELTQHSNAMLHGSANKEREVVLPLKSVPPAVRTAKALGVLGFGWGLAVLTFFVPVLHFILVPLFFFGGLFAAYRTLTFKALLGATTLQCPDCGEAEEFPSQRFRETIYFVCHSCGQYLCLTHK